MRAYQITEFGLEHLDVVEMDVPRPGPGEVLVRINAVSLNYRDLMVVTGTYNPRMRLPAIPFSDAAGEVVEIGDGVKLWKPGDRVMPSFVQRWIDGRSTQENRRTALGAGSRWQGVLREFATFNEEGLVSIPEHLSYDEAATLPCAPLAAWNALHVSGCVRSGETVLTLGTGGVSVSALQFAKMAGARVIATSGSNEKLARLADIGADATINYRETEDWDRAVVELTGGLGADHVIEIGGAGTLERSVAATRVGGHIALIGALSGSAPFDPISVFMRSIRLHGIFGGSRTMFEDMARAVSQNRLRPVIDRVFAFEEAREALEYLCSGEHFGKIVVRLA